jgi:putative transposase
VAAAPPAAKGRAAKEQGFQTGAEKGQKGAESKGMTQGHLMPDHVHMLISIPPKYSVAEVFGYLKGKSSIWIAQNVERKLRNFLGHKFWARGYFVSTVGRDEEMIRAYIKDQEMADKQLDQLQLKLASS